MIVEVHVTGDADRLQSCPRHAGDSIPEKYNSQPIKVHLPPVPIDRSGMLAGCSGNLCWRVSDESVKKFGLPTNMPHFYVCIHEIDID